MTEVYSDVRNNPIHTSPYYPETDGMPIDTTIGILIAYRETQPHQLLIYQAAMNTRTLLSSYYYFMTTPFLSFPHPASFMCVYHFFYIMTA